MRAIGIVRRFGELVKKAEELTIDDIVQGKVPTEPSITDRYLANLQNVINEYGEDKGCRFDVATLRDKGPNAPEHEYGADFVSVLNIDIEGYNQKKGFLCQAKKEGDLVTVQNPFFRTTVTFSYNQEFERLKGQTEDMLEVTPDSFVIVYSNRGFMVVPASSVSGLRMSGTLYAKPAVRFFKEFLMCFIGDPRLTAWDIKSLEALRTEYKARRAIMFSISETNDDANRKPEMVIYH
jgi:hypothetical protein